MTTTGKLVALRGLCVGLLIWPLIWLSTSDDLSAQQIAVLISDQLVAIGLWLILGKNDDR